MNHNYTEELNQLDAIVDGLSGPSEDKRKIKVRLQSFTFDLIAAERSVAYVRQGNELLGLGDKVRMYERMLDAQREGGK